ncbi:MAG: preprotein translocase subunit SecA, partial [Thermoflexibacteraceae bacterium]
DKLGLEEGEVIQHSMITKSIERAQKKVEENNFAVRKRLLEYDDVMNMQRKVVYDLRKNALFGERLGLDIMTMFRKVTTNITENYKGDFELFKQTAFGTFGFVPHSIDEMEFQKAKSNEIAQKLYTEAYSHYQNKNQEIANVVLPVLTQVYQQHGQQIANVVIAFTDGRRNIQIGANLQYSLATQGQGLFMALEQNIVLGFIDQLWREHLKDMDDLRQQVQFASLEQKDPLLVYKFEGYKLFEAFIFDLNEQITSFLAKAHLLQDNQQAPPEEFVQEAELPPPPQPKLVEQKADIHEVSSIEEAYEPQMPPTQQPPVQQQVTRPVVAQKIPNRNDKVTVQYADGSVKKDVKFKSVEDDLRAGKCMIIE